MSNRLFELQKRERFPRAILCALLFTVLCSVVVLLVAGTESPLSALFGLPLLLFLPGYVLFTASFPSARLTSERVIDSNEQEAVNRTTIGPVEGITLSVVGSISLSMLVGFTLNFTPWGITLESTVVSLCGFTLLTGAVAVFRRWKRAPRKRSTRVMSSLPFPNDEESDRNVLRRDVFVAGFSAFALLFGTGTAVYAVTAPPRAETYSQFHLLTEDESGEVVADDYPKEFVSGESKPITVGITNNEQAATSYEVIVELQRVENEGEDLEIVDQETLDRYRTSLRTEETERTVLDLVPTMTGEQLRLVFLLYRDDPTADPSMETAYCSLHLWIDVVDA